MTTLRETLLGPAIQLPEFRLLLPAGWECLPLTDATIAEFGRRASELFRRAGRPDLDGTFTPTMARGLTRAAGAGARYAILPTSTPEGRPMPLSMVVSTIDAPGGASLDAFVRDRFRAGAEMLDPTGAVVSWRSERRGADEEAGTRQAQPHYLAAVPGTERRKGLLLTGTALLEDDGDAEHPVLLGSHALFDAIASTLTWMPAAEGAEARA